MIKPKGRPATQCLHCRDNRKIKNLHILCTCGKKGKSATSHSAGCACHKTNHCTCAANVQGNKKNKDSIDNGKLKSLLENEFGKWSNSISSQTASNPSDTSPGSITTSSYQTISPGSAATSFSTHPSTLQENSHNNNNNNNSSNNNNNSSNNNNNNSNNNNNNNSSNNQQSSSHQNVSSVGNRELSHDFVIEDVLIPFDTRDGLFDFGKHGSFGGNHTDKSTSVVNENNGQTNGGSKTQNSNGGAGGISISNGDQESFHLSPGEIEVVDHMFPLFPLVGTQSFDNENQPLSGVPQEIRKTITHQPTPMRRNVGSHDNTFSSQSSLQSVAENSFPNHSYQHSRPKRPESVLSIASNSSARSLDFLGANYLNYNNPFLNGGVPLVSNSTAYPPSGGIDELGASNLNCDEHGSNGHHQFGKTGLGSNKFGSQLSKIESQMYTDSFDQALEQPSFKNEDKCGENQRVLSSSSSIPNFYNVNEPKSSLSVVDLQYGSGAEMLYANDVSSVSQYDTNKMSFYDDIPFHRDFMMPEMTKQPEDEKNNIQ
ncbi:HAA1 [Candida oxycetoniae]|uniref:HAA1 n=1 Tax=Candida oxycetoniae TaxID=497107 RepID=A0AAI9SUJ6_9ASCO|nr:HAA1 [Candida oxycetoniae]KAI3402959.2 HAA1 [Candida oxycetoniae]